jgi:hypothetical protein
MLTAFVLSMYRWYKFMIASDFQKETYPPLLYRSVKETNIEIRGMCKSAVL